MSVTALPNELEQAETALRACFENGEGYERQKALEAQISELRDRLHHAEIKEIYRKHAELEQRVEDELALAAQYQKLMAELAEEIDEKAEELYYLRENHASWSAQKYVAEVNARNAQSAIRDL